MIRRRRQVRSVRSAQIGATSSVTYESLTPHTSRHTTVISSGSNSQVRPSLKSLIADLEKTGAEE
jgi:hypothetical protein